MSEKSILVRTGYGAEFERSSPGKIGDSVVLDGLDAAADWILNDLRGTPDLNRVASLK